MLEPLAELAPELDRPGRGTVSDAPRGATIGRVSHLDELDEFEAELELRLKKEYSGGLRALPLLRAHAGRDVPLQQARPAVRPAAGVPVLPPEDGGRLGLGQEPPDADDPARRGLHLERRHGRGAARRGRRAGAHRRGARRADRRASLATTTSSSPPASPTRCCSRSTSATPRPSSGSSTASALSEQFRVGTDPHAHGRRARGDAAGVRRPRGARRDRALVDGAALDARVRGVRRALGGRRAARARARACRPACRSATTTRARSGPDRIANAVAARERHGAPAIVVDFGTSTNFDVVSAAGEYVGGVLAPGIEISMDALFARAARLREGAVRRAASA